MQAGVDGVAQLPAGLLAGRDGRAQVGLRLASGLDLPGWIRFDPRSGELRVDNRQLARFGQLDLMLRGLDAQGQQASIKVQLSAEGQTQQAALPGSQSLTQLLAAL